MDLALTFETIGPCAVLHCDGRIVFGPHADCLVKRCAQIFDNYRALGLELSGVTALDSGGIGSLVRVLNTARKEGKELAIISPSPKCSTKRLSRSMSTAPKLPPLPRPS